MDKLLEDRLYECIVLENQESILSLIQQGNQNIFSCFNDNIYF